MNKRQATEIAFAIVLVMVNPLFIIISLPLTAIFIIDCLLFRERKKKEEKEKEVPIEEENNIEAIRATVEEIEDINAKDLEYRRNVDLRQFRGREDVTKKEVEEYLWFHHKWEGFEEKRIICQEIIKVSNITKEDIKEVMKKHFEKGGKWITDYELKAEEEYINKKVRKKDKENEKFEEEENKSIKNNKYLMEVNEIIKGYEKPTNEEHKYIFYYEDWLKEKGYS